METETCDSCNQETTEFLYSEDGEYITCQECVDRLEPDYGGKVDWVCTVDERFADYAYDPFRKGVEK